LSRETRLSGLVFHIFVTLVSIFPNFSKIVSTLTKTHRDAKCKMQNAECGDQFQLCIRIRKLLPLGGF